MIANIWAWRVLCLTIFLELSGNFKPQEPRFHPVDIAWGVLTLIVYGLGFVIAAIGEGVIKAIKQE